jgi:hypothetical protein
MMSELLAIIVPLVAALYGVSSKRSYSRSACFLVLGAAQVFVALFVSAFAARGLIDIPSGQWTFSDGVLKLAKLMRPMHLFFASNAIALVALGVFRKSAGR